MALRRPRWMRGILYESALRSAQLSILKGDFQAALKAAQLAVRFALARRDEDPDALIGALACLSSAYMIAGDLTNAVHYAERAKDMADDRPETHAGVRAMLFAQHGALYSLQGRPQDALAALEDAARAVASATDPQRPTFATVLVTGALAGAYAEVGDFRRALHHYLAALAAVDELPDAERVLEPQLLADLALLFRDMGDWSAAASGAEAALESAARMPSVSGPALVRLQHIGAVTQRSIGDLDSAMRLLEEASRFWEPRVPVSHPERVANVLARAAVAADGGDEETACRLLEPLCADPDVPEAAALVAGYGVALLEYRSGLVERALRRTVELERRAPDVLGDMHVQTAALRVLSALLKARSGRLPEALASVREASATDSRVQWAAFGAGSERVRAATVDRLTSHLCAELTVAGAAHTAGLADASEVACLCVLRRKGAELEALRGISALTRSRHSGDPEALTELRAISRRLTEAVLDHGEALSEEDVAELEGRRQFLEFQASAAAPEAELREQVARATPAAVIDTLPHCAAVVEFVRWYPFDIAEGVPDHSARYVAFVMSHEGIEMFDLGAAGEVEGAVARYRAAVARALSQDPPGATDLAPQMDLARLLAPPLTHAIRRARADRIVIAPDHALSLVPWLALPLQDGRRLGDVVRVDCVTAARDLLRGPASSPSSRRRAFDSSLVMAAPEYGPEEGAAVTQDLSAFRGYGSRRLIGPFPPLPGTMAEGLAVGELLGVAPLTGTRATRSALLDSTGPRVIHLATHGFFLGTDGPAGLSPETWTGLASAPQAETLHHRQIDWVAGPRPLLRCGLALSGANRRPVGESGGLEAGVVTAEDVVHMDLEGTQLVVLSACDTGLGTLRPGEGVLGLTRAFLVAGAEAVVTSLWKVHDGITVGFMKAFYDELTRSDPATALRHAQRTVRTSFPDPACWAGFVLFLGRSPDDMQRS
ncbi:CHAT domain-containing protein [Streptomyces sp. 15-116A]|uniref:CHAT domain-containing protein n=1 Tax=Streptomyces sp. 15-116A TaxID=2259035 RepID=UPI0021B1C298|nr:CHAT domain-containing protein [Streptomyces sp. 15-116A]MCT7351087.1 CHAT domain-containing protein [Streptomyces sp. 15-116A]